MTNFHWSVFYSVFNGKSRTDQRYEEFYLCGLLLPIGGGKDPIPTHVQIQSTRGCFYKQPKWNGLSSLVSETQYTSNGNAI